MYEPGADPYCYPDSGVLRNLAGLASQTALDRFEAVATGRRFLEPMPSGRWGTRHYRAIHRHIFQDVYAWAGEDRTVRMTKGGSVFCYPEFIDSELHRIFRGLKADGFYRGFDRQSFVTTVAHFLAELNAIHPFRDGNGRTQLVFLALLSARAGRHLDLERLDPTAYLNAMITSFQGDEAPLVAQIAVMIESA